MDSVGDSSYFQAHHMSNNGQKRTLFANKIHSFDKYTNSDKINTGPGWSSYLAERSGRLWNHVPTKSYTVENNTSPSYMMNNLVEEQEDSYNPYIPSPPKIVYDDKSQDYGFVDDKIESCSDIFSETDEGITVITKVNNTSANVTQKDSEPKTILIENSYEDGDAYNVVLNEEPEFKFDKTVGTNLEQSVKRESVETEHVAETAPTNPFSFDSDTLNASSFSSTKNNVDEESNVGTSKFEEAVESTVQFKENFTTAPNIPTEHDSYVLTHDDRIISTHVDDLKISHENILNSKPVVTNKSRPTDTSNFTYAATSNISNTKFTNFGMYSDPNISSANNMEAAYRSGMGYRDFGYNRNMKVQPDCRFDFNAHRHDINPFSPFITKSNTVYNLSEADSIKMRTSILTGMYNEDSLVKYFREAICITNTAMMKQVVSFLVALMGENYKIRPLCVRLMSSALTFHPEEFVDSFSCEYLSSFFNPVINDEIGGEFLRLLLSYKSTFSTPGVIEENIPLSMDEDGFLLYNKEGLDDYHCGKLESLEMLRICMDRAKVKSAFELPASRLRDLLCTIWYEMPSTCPKIPLAQLCFHWINSKDDTSNMKDSAFALLQRNKESLGPQSGSSWLLSELFLFMLRKKGNIHPELEHIIGLVYPNDDLYLSIQSIVYNFTEKDMLDLWCLLCILPWSIRSPDDPLCVLLSTALRVYYDISSQRAHNSYSKNGDYNPYGSQEFHLRASNNFNDYGGYEADPGFHYSVPGVDYGSKYTVEYGVDYTVTYPSGYNANAKHSNTSPLGILENCLRICVCRCSSPINALNAILQTILLIHVEPHCIITNQVSPLVLGSLSHFLWKCHFLWTRIKDGIHPETLLGLTELYSILDKAVPCPPLSPLPHESTKTSRTLPIFQRTSTQNQENRSSSILSLFIKKDLSNFDRVADSQVKPVEVDCRLRFDEPQEPQFTYLAPCGLKNLGNTCYFNALLQSLYHTRFFVYNIFKWAADDEKSNRFLSSLHKLFKKMMKNRKRPINPSESYDMISELLQDGQQDVTEAIRFISEALDFNLELWKSVFAGLIVRRIQCLRCSSISDNEETLYDFNFSLSKTTSIQDLFEEFCGVEVLSGENKYFCLSCNKDRKAHMWNIIASPPSHLIIILNRNSWHIRSHDSQKVFKRVKIDNTLHITGFDYKLYGSIIHSGDSTHSGHYYFIGCDSETFEDWYKFDDSTIKRADEESIDALSQDHTNTHVPYVLFYRCLQAPPTPNI
ncbi:Ubiquitin carboxyl-terminal hydrolase family member protein [Theileria equi strain WA]|uniref:Ubiquitin carboxyl-terminal hydrolase family member protein n=1 Tax=Theileria equi strain WA TaxID=1537102 RepID=L1LDC3_THEEQ|nr:Ubiquitin carboxyl-terminal hydrolase family member protein [Theileria equi strain WA]EKX73254.1 Ubiquitin carboxyl-terminal hydrolase family member protein [Theileria equi strain WA]|eukprot:XP_004832706.1 Ubiquitin carboxyl-terminal hydrolase family member protein [Theileria equi strain WA]